jgi:ABC-type transport system involved in cytochrome c biogenesis, permease component
LQQAAIALARKDLTIEFRRPYEIVSILAFSLGSLLVGSLALRGISLRIPEYVAAILWILIFFASILTLTTSFTRETDRGTFGGLKTLPCSPLAILAGKALYGVAILLPVITVLVPSSLIFFDLTLWDRFPGLLLFCYLGAVSFAFVGSFVSGLVMFSEGKTLLLSMLLIPVCMPIILLSVMATSKILSDSPAMDILPELRLLLAYLLLTSAVILLTFSFILEE